jgi:hypothetical protein
MTFADLVAGESVFVDANILTYRFQPHPMQGPVSSNLLQRIDDGDQSESETTPAIRGLSKSANSSGVGTWNVSNHRDSASRSMAGFSMPRR